MRSYKRAYFQSLSLLQLLTTLPCLILSHTEAKIPFTIAMTRIAVIAAILSCMLARTQADVLVHMDPRDSLTFEEPDLTNIVDFGIQHAAVYFPTWTREERKKIVPSRLGEKKNWASHGFDVFCETSGANELAYQLEKECGKNCPDDHDVFVSFGTLPGENFIEDGILHYGCGVVKVSLAKKVLLLPRSPRIHVSNAFKHAVAKEMQEPHFQLRRFLSQSGERRFRH